MYKVRQKGTGKYISGTQDWAFVSSDKAHVWKDEETARNVAEHCPVHLRGRLEVVAMDDQADGGKKDEPAVRESTKKTTEAEKSGASKESPKKTANAKKEDFSDDIAALSGMRPESLMKLIRYAYVIRESIDQMTDFYGKKVSKYNGIEQDILHAIEFSDGFSVDEKVALFDRLKVNRKARRENKDICQLLLAFGSGENVAKIYDGLPERIYGPRQDESLFHNEEKDA